MKYAIYARVSPKGSSFEVETTIGMQVDFCRKYIESQHGEIVDIQTDEFFSGKDLKRPGFKKLMSDVKNGTAKWDVLCVYKLSRMTRSSRDGANIFEDLRANNKGFVSATEPSFDFSTPIGRAMLAIFQAFNQFEREQTGENTKNKMVSIAASGCWPSGNPPVGYVRGAKHDNVLKPDPRGAEMVRAIFEAYASDMPLFRITRKFHRCAQSILYILHNRTYLEKIVYDGKEYDGKHPSIINPLLFDSVQSKLSRKDQDTGLAIRPKMHSRNYLLAGLLKCGKCGHYLSPESAKSGEYFYYRCTDRVNCKTRVNALEIEDKVIAILAHHAVDADFIRGFRDEIKQIRAEQAAQYRPEIKSLSSALSSAKSEREKLYKVLASGVLDKKNAKYINDKLGELDTEITGLQSKLEFYRAEVQRIDDNIPSGMENLADDMLRLKDVLSKIPEEDNLRRELVSTYVREIRYFDAEKMEIEFNLPDEGSDKLKNGCPTWTRTKTK